MGEVVSAEVLDPLGARIRDKREREDGVGRQRSGREQGQRGDQQQDEDGRVKGEGFRVKAGLPRSWRLARHLAVATAPTFTLDFTLHSSSFTLLFGSLLL